MFVCVFWGVSEQVRGITLQRDLAAKWKRGTTAQKGTKLWRVISAGVTGTVA